MAIASFAVMQYTLHGTAVQLYICGLPVFCKPGPQTAQEYSIVVASMNRSIAIFSIILVLFLISTSFAWLYRDGLARRPGDGSFNLLSPLSAFPLPNGGSAIVDPDSDRMARINAAGLIRWEIRPRALFGRFLSVDASPDGMLYGIA